MPNGKAATVPTQADFQALINELCGRSGLDPTNVTSIVITPTRMIATKQTETQPNDNGVSIARTTTFTQNVTGTS